MHKYYDFTTGLEGQQNVREILERWNATLEQTRSEEFFINTLSKIKEDNASPLFTVEKILSDIARPLTEARHALQPEAPTFEPFLGSVFSSHCHRLWQRVQTLRQKNPLKDGPKPSDAEMSDIVREAYNFMATDYMVGDLDNSFGLRELNTAVNLRTSGLDDILDEKQNARRLESLHLNPKRAKFIQQNEKICYSFKFGLEPETLTALFALERIYMPYVKLVQWSDAAYKAPSMAVDSYETKARNMVTAKMFANVSSRMADKIEDALRFAIASLNMDGDTLEEKILKKFFECTENPPASSPQL